MKWEGGRESDNVEDRRGESGGGGGGGGVMGGGMFTLVQISIMFWIAVILSIAHLVTRQAHPGLGSATKGAWLAIGLTVLLSFPVCLLVDQIQPTSFH